MELHNTSLGDQGKAQPGWPVTVKGAALRRMPRLGRLLRDRERLSSEVHELRSEIQLRERHVDELRQATDALERELNELRGEAEKRNAILDALPVADGFQPRRVRHQYGPVQLSVYLGDSVAAEWYDVEWPDVPEITFLSRFQTRPPATVFDLGAHQGVYALMLAHAVNPRGRVVAVEANQFNVEVIHVNSRLNKVQNIEPVHAAVADKSGWISFGRGGNGQVDPGGHFEDSQAVPAITIDELTERYGTPRMIFLDVEGFECHALRAAKETLTARPDVFIEVHVSCGLEDFGGSVDELVSFFLESEYDLYGSHDWDRYPKPFVGDHRRIAAERFYLIAIAKHPRT